MAIKKIKLNSKIINYFQVGAGQPLILLHGWNNNWQGWQQMIDILQAHYRIYALDYPGYGDSENLASYSLKDSAKYVVLFIKKLKIKPIIVGTSLGSYVATLCSLSLPTMIKKTVLIGAPISKNNTTVNIFYRFFNFFLRYPQFQPLFLKMVKSKAYGHLTARFINMCRYDKEVVEKYGMAGRQKSRSKSLLELISDSQNINLSKIIPKIVVPTLLIWGKQDRLVDFRRIKQMTAKLDENRFRSIFIPECGHVVHFEKPKEASKLIIDFLPS